MSVQSRAIAKPQRQVLFVISAAAIAFALLFCLCAQAQVRESGLETGFQARALLAVSDADMKASAYVEGKLGSFAGEDTLTVLRTGMRLDQIHPATVPASNSVAGPPQSIAVSPDGKTAVVIETWGPRPTGRAEATMKDLAPGHLVTVVDLSDLDHPRVVQELHGFEHPLSVTINHTGTLVAIAYGLPSSAQQPALVLYGLQGGRLLRPIIAKIPGFEPKDVLISAEFAPAKDVLALLYSTHPRLSFVHYVVSGDAVQMEPWGNDVGLDHQPFLVRFTPNGRYAVVNDMYYGSDVSDVQGTLLSVAVNQAVDAQQRPIHRIVSHVSAEDGPEGLAISPDGQWVVTTNLEHSYEPVTSPLQGFFSSISLLHLSPDSGRLERMGVFPFDGVLPEAAAFSNDSKMLAVTNFDRFDGKQPGGSIDFWRLTEDRANPGRTLLIKTVDSIPVTRGPQSMVVLR